MDLVQVLYIILIIITIIYVFIVIYYMFYYRDVERIEIKNEIRDLPKEKVNKDIKMIKNEDLNTSGIAGMEEYLEIINKKVLASRTLSKEVSDQLGVRPVKGILIYGKPGNGKTMIATAIGKYLNSEEPIIVSGPSLITKWIGDSEKNVRDLFEPAKNDQNSGSKNLHLIIFDEFDSIGRKRNSEDIYGTYNNIVNQLLTMMDGPEALNNILVVAITNRKEDLDPALLRPGRFEVHIEVKEPDMNQRLKILNIKTKKLQENDYLSDDVNLSEIAFLTENYSGADIEGLVNGVVNDMIYYKINNQVDKKITQNDFISNLKVISKDVPINKSIIEKLISNANVF